MNKIRNKQNSSNEKRAKYIEDFKNILFKYDLKKTPSHEEILEEIQRRGLNIPTAQP